MKNFEDYKIRFAGLKNGKHDFHYPIDNTFFSLFDYKEFNAVEVEVTLQLEKKTSLLELAFIINGSVNVNCDVSNEPYDQPIESKLNLVIKFGDEYRVENEELLILPRDAFEIEVQQYIYEAIILAVPYKKVHPKVADGTMDSKILDKLDELSPNHHNDKENTDPRWDKLKGLLNQK